MATLGRKHNEHYQFHLRVVVMLYLGKQATLEVFRINWRIATREKKCYLDCSAQQAGKRTV